MKHFLFHEPGGCASPVSGSVARIGIVITVIGILTIGPGLTMAASAAVLPGPDHVAPGTGPTQGPSSPPGTFQTVDFPGATDTWVFGNGLHEPNEFVGQYEKGGVFHGFTDRKGTFRTVDDPEGTSSYVVGVTSSGALVGGYETATFVYYGFIDNAGTFTTVSDPSAIVAKGSASATNGTSVSFANGAGDIAGEYVAKSDGKLHGFIDVGGKFTTVDYPPPTAFDVIGSLNAAATELVGEKETNSNDAAFIDQNGTFSLVSDPADPPSYTFLAGIAPTSGKIVGLLSSPTALLGGFELTGSTFTHLNDPAGITAPQAISDSGIVTGYYYDTGHNAHGFVFTPK
jgi:hypothetical protein